jgi:hypothetical protein
MVRLYSDAEMDEKCKDFRPVPLKLYRVVYGLEGKGTNPLTTTKSDRMMALPGANINLATKSNIPLNPVPASLVKLRYNELYQDVIVEGKKLNQDIDIEEPIPTSAPAVDPEDEIPPPNEEPETERPSVTSGETGGSDVRSREGVIGGVIVDVDGVAENIELIEKQEVGEVKVGRELGKSPENGRGVQGQQFQTDPTKKGRKGGRGGKSQPSGVGVIGEVGQTAPDKKGRQGQRQIS